MFEHIALFNFSLQTGFKLLMDSSEDDFSAIMLISLSRIAFSWKLLIPSQVQVTFVYVLLLLGRSFDL